MKSMQDFKFLRLGSSHRRSLTAQTRIYYFIAACAVSLLAIFVGIFTPLILFHNADSKYSTNIATVERAIAFDYAKQLSESIMVGYAVTQALEGYVMSRMQRLPNMSLPASERVAGQNFTDFTDFARLLFANTANIASSMLLPGGVYTNMYPVANDTYMRDIFDADDYAQHFLPTPQQAVLDGDVSYIGPFLSTVNFMRGYWGLVVRRPVFNRTDYEVAGWDIFWGFTMTVLNISAILEQQPFALTQLEQKKQYRNVDYVVSVQDSLTGTLQVMQSSFRHLSPAELTRFVREGTSVNVTPNHPFTVTVRGRDYGKWLSANNVSVVMATVVAGTFLCLAIITACVLYRTRVYDGTVHAPKMAPFAMLTVGPCRGEELWDLAPDEMVEVTDRLSALLTRQMVRHHAYQIQQVHPLTTSYVTRGVAAAVQMAFDTIEELQSSPIDDALRRLLGDDGCLLLSYAVHWCTDAVVRLDPMEGGYRYEGPDVVYGGRMWAFAAPSVVTASEAVADALPRFGLRCLSAVPYRRVNVVRSRSVCGATGDCDVMNGGGGGSSSSGAATIYVPYPAPTTVEATAGMGGSSGGGITAGTQRHAQNKDVVLPPQTLLTLIDERRPLLVAARSAAPVHHHHPPLSSSFAMAAIQTANTSSAHPTHEHVSGPITVSVQDADAHRHHHPQQDSSGNGHSSSSFHSSEEEMSAAVLPAPLPAPVPASSGTEAGVSNTGTTAMLRSSFVIQGDGVTRVLLRPDIPHALDVALHVAFDYQAITLGMTYDAARVLVYYFYSSYKILFRPLAAPERHNIYRRLVTAFGVPQQGILEHLAARCAIRCLQQSAKQRQLAVQRRHVEDDAPLPIVTTMMAAGGYGRATARGA